jgi:hypothetical protein
MKSELIGKRHPALWGAGLDRPGRSSMIAGMLGSVSQVVVVIGNVRFGGPDGITSNLLRELAVIGNENHFAEKETGREETF